MESRVLSICLTRRLLHAAVSQAVKISTCETYMLRRIVPLGKIDLLRFVAERISATRMERVWIMGPGLAAWLVD